MPFRCTQRTKLALAILCLFLAAPGQLAAQAQSGSQVDSETGRTQEPTDLAQPALSVLKATGLERSRFKHYQEGEALNVASSVAPQADFATFEETVRPLLSRYCVDCHGKEDPEGNIRIDSLNPDLLRGGDTDWWLEVFAVISKEEMPPADYDEMPAEDRRAIVEWLSSELQAASLLRRESETESSFRRLTRYEYNYALQDLLGLPWNFAKDLPPDPRSDDGFENNADLLHLSVSQFETYHRLARQALNRATVVGTRPPALYWGISMSDLADREFREQDAKLKEAKQKHESDPEKLESELARLHTEFHKPHDRTHYKVRSTNRTAVAKWSYPGASYAVAPSSQPPQPSNEHDCVAILPGGRRQNLVVELGNQLPDEGMLRVSVHASRVSADGEGYPSLQLWFGWQASNEGRALLRVSHEDVPVTAIPGETQIIEWEIPLGEIYPRNSVRKTSPMGAIPSPSEYIRIANSSANPQDVQIEYVQVEAPFYEQWPPASHQRIFTKTDRSSDEEAEARKILLPLMTRAWRRPVTPEELDRKIKFFRRVRGDSETFEQAILEVLATVLSSPQFLFVGQQPGVASGTSSNAESDKSQPRELSQFNLASRLALFLWSSVPDERLLTKAQHGELADPNALAAEVERMLQDPRSERFSKHFVQQWLNLELLEFVNFRQHVGGFDPLLKEAMQQEPVALFSEIIHTDASVLDFLHADYAMLNERLARHYNIPGVYGNHLRRVPLTENAKRGGLLTQAGFLAMNSDWPDSHPLKRAIWLLECLLADPPPPPPPAVPQIDLADPEIAKMTLKERMEDHRNQAACRSCHAKIDPWGIAFENYDALGRWRENVNGKPIDASSELFNRQTIDGMEGLKRFLLQDRQDQFVHAMASKLMTYALGRPIGFAHSADLDVITARTRKKGDGLKTMILEIVKSDLFQDK